MGILAETNSGDAYSLSLDGQFYRQQLRIRGELAQSTFDFDGADTGFKAEQDQAYDLLLSYSPTPNVQTELPVAWNFSVVKQHIQPYFYSLANEALVADRDTTTFYANATRGPWGVNSAYSTTGDNLDDQYLQTNTSHGVNLGINYSAATPYEPASAWGWLGTPFYSLTLNETHSDIDTQTLGLTNSFAYEYGSWYLSLSRSTLDDADNPLADATTTNYGLGMDITLGDDTSISASTSQITTEEKASGLNTLTWDYLVTVNYASASDKFRGNLSLNLIDTDDKISQPAVDYQQLFIGSALSYELVSARRWRPAVVMGVSGSYADTDEITDISDASEIYQILFTLRLNWDYVAPSPVGQ